MPLTEKGEKIKENTVKQYGEKKGEQVVHALIEASAALENMVKQASKNKGTITGIDRADKLAKIADKVGDLFERSTRLDQRMDAIEEADKEFIGPDGKQK